MDPKETIYILGSGAVGFPLAVYLSNAGRHVIAVRTSRSDVPPGTVTVTVHNGAEISALLETLSLAQLPRLEGLIVVTAKSYANAAIARELRQKTVAGPVVIMQNGVGVERPFLDAGFSPIYRCILYVTSQAVAENVFKFRPVSPGPIGIINGNPEQLEQCVAALSTPAFPFRIEANIQREIWKKAIINAVFNSICPLLDIDNGIFARDESVASLAREVVQECLTLTERLGIELGESEIMEQLLRISQGSHGQLISTLQDIRHGRPTEIESLNLEIARVAATLQPPLPLPKTELLGKMILAKSAQQSARG